MGEGPQPYVISFKRSLDWPLLRLPSLKQLCSKLGERLVPQRETRKFKASCSFCIPPRPAINLLFFMILRAIPLNPKP